MDIEELEIEEALHRIFIESDLLIFENLLVFDLQLTRIEHFQYITDEELRSHGISLPAIRRLRDAIEKRQKLIKKGKICKVELDKRMKLKKTISPTASNIPTSPCLIPKEELVLMETLGEGTFAVVKRAIWKRPDGVKLDTAVKILRSTNNLSSDMITEISSLQKLKHQNLSRLFGIVLGVQTLMVMEFCEGGSLLSRLRNQTKEKLLVTTLLRYSQQISYGMAYLESKRFVHRDLAARNILLTKNDEIVKICDFGLTRSLGENERLYVMTAQNKIPFAWCPPESLRFRQFSHKSDVWAFGVTLWELFTYGEDPWAGLSAIDVMKIIESGEQLKRPEFCSSEIWDLITMCWKHQPDDRPKFSTLRKNLLDIRFMPVVCRCEKEETNCGKDLSFTIGDKIILITERGGAQWYGQNIRTKRFGTFPRSAVAVETPPLVELANFKNVRAENYEKLENGNGTSFYHRREISCPITGSFIHTGHGDIDEDRCWGNVDKINELYLKNPITCSSIGPIKTSLPGKVNFVPTIHNVATSELTDIHQEPKETSAHCENDESSFISSSKETSNFASDWLLESKKPANQSLQQFKDYCVERELFAINNQSQNSTSQIYSAITNFLPPPPLPSDGQNSAREGKRSTNSNSTKYDSAISIPRPNRSSPNLASKSVTPPPAFAFQLNHSKDKQQNEPTPRPHSQILTPASISYNEKQKQSVEQKQFIPLQSSHCPNNNHLFDPFELNDQVKTLTKTLRYNDVHKLVSESTANDVYNKPSLPCPNIQQKLSSLGNVECSTAQPNLNSSTANPYTHDSNSLKYVSLLPPPSDLLLYGSLSSERSPPTNLSNNLAHFFYSETKKDKQTESPRNCLIFDISNRSSMNSSSNSASSFDHHQKFHQKSNDIPYIGQVLCSSNNTQIHDAQNDGLNANKKAPVIIDLSDLDPSILTERVQKGANFANSKECWQSLKKCDYDVERAIQNLKIERLIEMGLATDRNLASSALATSQWDLNTAANKLVTP